MQTDKKPPPMLVTEFGIIGGVVSDVQPYKKLSPILVIEF
jgi:hypothetical protein